MKSSRADKFDKLFAGRSVASNIQEHNDDDDDNSNTSQIIDEKHLHVGKKLEKVNSWNDSDLSFQENPLTPRDQEEPVNLFY
jgi:hypothetical protein